MTVDLLQYKMIEPWLQKKDESATAGKFVEKDGTVKENLQVKKDAHLYVCFFCLCERKSRSEFGMASLCAFSTRVLYCLPRRVCVCVCVCVLDMKLVIFHDVSVCIFTHMYVYMHMHIQTYINMHVHTVEEGSRGS